MNKIRFLRENGSWVGAACRHTITITKGLPVFRVSHLYDSRAAGVEEASCLLAFTFTSSKTLWIAEQAKYQLRSAFLTVSR